MNWRGSGTIHCASSTASSAASSAVSSATLFVCAAPRPYSLSTALCPLLFVGCVGIDGARTASRGIRPQINAFRRSDVCDPWPWTKLIPPNDLRTKPIPPTDKTADGSLDLMLASFVRKGSQSNNISRRVIVRLKGSQSNNISRRVVNPCVRPSPPTKRKRKGVIGR